jgi:predicted ATPase
MALIGQAGDGKTMLLAEFVLHIEVNLKKFFFFFFIFVFILKRKK